MKISVFNKLLIGSVALASCQNPKAVHYTAPVMKAVDTFVSSNAKTEKTFDLMKNVCEFFNGDFSKITVENSKKGSVGVRPKRTVNTNKKVSKPVSRPVDVAPVERKLSSTLDSGNYLITGNNILYAHPAEYTVPNGVNQRWNNIASANGVSLYRLKLANPDIDPERAIPAGTVLKIPERYIVNSGSVKSFDDVVKTTGINKHYINDILICIEGRHQKPDLVCKSDGVRSKEYPKGCPTIGYGHTGRVDGKIIVNGRTRITEEKAYELLAQDILDAKLDAIVYMGKSLFDRAPESVQTGIIDIVFNKGVEPFSRKGSPTTMIKGDLEKGDYAAAAAHTVLKTGNRGLKKRNVFRVILSTKNLSQPERDKTLSIARPHYIETLNKFPGKRSSTDRNRMQKAWANAKNGVTYGFFN